MKSSEHELPVPTAWRPTLRAISNGIISGNLSFREIPHVKEATPEVSSLIGLTVGSYGDNLIELPEDTWESSVCRWMGHYWRVLLDLYTEHGRPSDLVLFCNVFERDDGYLFEVESVHVP